jgi:inosine-uridine nucleoside N-ribohydrolase
MTPVILDTDIGTDIDDTWALAMLTRCPELDLRLVTTASGDTTYRARIVAGILAAAGREDVAIGVGIPTELPKDVPAKMWRPQAPYADEIDLDSYSGAVHADGVAALVDCVLSSSEPVTIITIGPVTNVAVALATEPAIAERARVVGMLGSVRSSGPFSDKAGPEYNVLCDVSACRALFAAPWNVTITPLDTCGWISLAGDRYAAVRDSDDRLLTDVMRNYRAWSNVVGWEEFEEKTTTLFDTVAVYLAYDESLLEIEQLPIHVEDDGSMTVAAGSPELRVATSWHDQDAFTDHLLERLVN